MRKCENCFNGHFNLSDRGEELFCDINEFAEENVEIDHCCEYHRYIPGTEEENNYVMFDDKYLGPGFIIINKKNKEIVKFFKIYILNNHGFPSYGIRAYSVKCKDKPDKEFTNIEFTFRDIEDEENGLYKTFSNLDFNLNGNKVGTIDIENQGKNNFSLLGNGNVCKLTIAKDVYGVKHATDFIEINVGDNISCKNYDAINAFYNDLTMLCPNVTNDKDLEELLLIRNKKN